jgi:hypothetical protein
MKFSMTGQEKSDLLILINLVESCVNIASVVKWI